MKHIVFAAIGSLFLGWLAAAAQPARPPRPAVAPGQPVPAGLANSQPPGGLSATPAQFIVDLQGWLASSTEPGSPASGTRFRQLWESQQLTTLQQARIIALTQATLRAGGQRPYIKLLLDALLAAKTTGRLGEQQLTQYLDVLQQSTNQALQTSKAPLAATTEFLQFTSCFFTRRRLYSANYNTLEVRGGTTGFGYQSAGGLLPSERAVLTIGRGALLLRTATDSVLLTQVSGVAVPGTGRLLATGGQVAWRVRNALITANLGAFDFAMRDPRFEARTATLACPTLLAAPVKGTLCYRPAHRRPPGAEAAGLRFTSATNDARLTGLGPGITYVGGLSLAGSHLGSLAHDSSGAVLCLAWQGRRGVRVAARSVEFSDSVIVAGQAQVTLYPTAGDSVTNASVDMLRYSLRRQAVTLSMLTRGNQRTQLMAPYAMEAVRAYVYAVEATWRLGERQIEFAGISTQGGIEVRVESMDYFSYNQYMEINALLKSDLLWIWQQSLPRAGAASAVRVPRLAEQVHLPVKAVRTALAGLLRVGYVAWNPRTDEVQLLPLGRHYARAARGLDDYDQLALVAANINHSVTFDAAATCLLLRGVRPARLFSEEREGASVKGHSVVDSAYVVLQPENANGQVRWERGRNLTFGGHVETRNYRYGSSHFQFSYAGYYIRMAQAGTMMRISQADGKTTGARRFADLFTNTEASHLDVLYLNDSTNRSGRRLLPQYPWFTSTTGGITRFNQREVLGGAYDAAHYCQTLPYAHSAQGPTLGNFPCILHWPELTRPLATTLTVQADGSRSITYPVPAEGLGLYANNVIAAGGSTLQLDNGGLQLAGTLQVPAARATLQGQHFVFYPDSLTGVLTAGTLAAGPDSPPLVLPAACRITLYRATGALRMQAPAGQAPILAYATQEVQVTGTLWLTGGQLTGQGDVATPQGSAHASHLTFGGHAYSCGPPRAGRADSATVWTRPGRRGLCLRAWQATYDLVAQAWQLAGAGRVGVGGAQLLPERGQLVVAYATPASSGTLLYYSGSNEEFSFRGILLLAPGGASMTAGKAVPTLDGYELRGQPRLELTLPSASVASVLTDAEVITGTAQQKVADSTRVVVTLGETTLHWAAGHPVWWGRLSSSTQLPTECYAEFASRGWRVYLGQGTNAWYYFQYADGETSATSSSQQLTQELKKPSRWAGATRARTVPGRKGSEERFLTYFQASYPAL